MKPYVKVTLTLHGGASRVIEDYVDGKFIPIGTQAAAMLDRHEAIHYVDAEGVEVIIPYHAIEGASITRESKEYTKPEDAFCKAEGGETLGRKISFTVDNVNVNGGYGFAVISYYIDGMCKAATVKFDHNGTFETVTESSPSSESEIYLNTEKGNYIVTLSVDAETGDYTLILTDTATSEETTIASLDLYVDNDKKYICYVDNPFSPSNYTVGGFYADGEQLVCAGRTKTQYCKIYDVSDCGGGSACCETFGEDNKLPAVTADACYEGSYS